MSQLNTKKNHSLSKGLLLISIAICFPAFMAGVELMGINVALHDIGKAFHADQEILTWILAAYILTNAGFYIFLGRVSDYIGHRNMLLWGCFGMALWSFLGIFSFNLVYLIIIRALQGLASASIIVSSLSLLKSEVDKNRQKLLTLWSSISGIGIATGPLIGGGLVKFFGWQGIFYWGFAASLISLIAVWRWMPKHEKYDTQFSGDIISTLLLFIFITCLMILLTMQLLFSKAIIITSWIIAPTSLTLFLVWQHYHRPPLIEFSLLKRPHYLLATLAGISLYYALYSYLFVFGLYFQKLGWSSLKTGAYLTISPIVFFITTYFIGSLVTFERCRIFFQFGSLVGAGSFLLLMLGDQAYSIGYLGGAILFGIAYACYSQPSLYLVGKECQRSNVGVGMGMLFTFRWIAGSFGVFISSSLMLNTRSETVDIINPCLATLAIFAITGMITTWAYQRP